MLTPQTKTCFSWGFPWVDLQLVIIRKLVPLRGKVPILEII
jgi:hypothetical protein